MPVAGKSTENGYRGGRAGGPEGKKGGFRDARMAYGNVSGRYL